MIVVMAASTTTSLTPAASSRPTGWLRSMVISTWRPWFCSNTADGAAASPAYPANFEGSASPLTLPSCRVTASAPSATA